jgi:hypothetical protein
MVVACPRRVRAGRSVAGDRAVHDVGVHRPNLVVPEAEPIGHTRAELLDHHVGLGGECEHPVALGPVFEVDGVGALAAI